ncbi:hypothetical protein SEA_ANNADREAMY_173 [Streptomyces phage Annadreamy]|uniref:Uncharacterized protein n=2 Tax=Annadreamyvirus annadreamy TaxID=2846392 RepID=A0A345GTI8_9CAUD|nr:hypothetical protein HWB75_gp103 [Streptomyces phage Annadreamy]AXG66260.1 hypothetical protein SEA_ANNADREAMY_173 [Streptomyces phage Annadreamy]QGH79483.1 hypothetical protein SEA_LIMPID_180 [Streptomyces phage Limpid]
MNFVTLWKDKDESTGITLHYAGDATVLESSILPIKAHYFETNSEAKEFIIKQAYALLSLGYEVHSE